MCFALVAQWIEQEPSKFRATGSIPVEGAQKTTTVPRLGWTMTTDNTTPAPRPQQLPPRCRSWMDRPQELATLDRLTTTGRRLIVLSGPQGAGKTTLAVHWAYEHLQRFPDGQLYADLRACSDTGPSLPSDILRGWLRALGDTRTELPEDLPVLTTDFQHRTEDMRLLVLLDDAISVAQVKCLLSTSTSAVTLVTTPWRLGGLHLDGAGFMRVERR